MEGAQPILMVLPKATVLDILEFLVDDYWSRYVGWPDLLVQKSAKWFFVEVKSSRRPPQRDPEDMDSANATSLGLPEQVMKIHRLSK